MFTITEPVLENPASLSSTEGPVVSYRHPVLNVLLATDGTNQAETALTLAINLVRNSGGRLILTFYANPDDQAVFGGDACPNREEWRAQGQQILDKLAQSARRAGVKQVETVLEHYQDEERLTQLAQELNTNYIVLASHLFSFG
jgi:nucleotide-binding universal stress UspA family protein